MSLCLQFFRCHNSRRPLDGPVRPFVNLGIGIGIGIEIETDIANVIISSSIRSMYPKLSRVVT